MKLIEQYQKSGKLLEEQLLGGECSLKKVVDVQELKYRVSVLSTMRTFENSAPIGGETEDINFHFRILTKFVGLLIAERRTGRKVDEAGQKKRETALEVLENIFESKKEEFEEFDFEEKAGSYAKFVKDFLCTIVPVWAQYRDTYIDVSKLPVGEEKQEKKTGEETTEDPMEKALSVMCPLSRFKGKTLGEVLREDPSVINYLAGKGAEKYGATHPKAVESAKLLCEYAKKKSKQTEETAA
jgi:hypothetical protein